MKKLGSFLPLSKKIFLTTKTLSFLQDLKILFEASQKNSESFFKNIQIKILGGVRKAKSDFLCQVLAGLVFLQKETSYVSHVRISCHVMLGTFQLK